MTRQRAGVIQCRSCLGLPLESFQGLPVLEEFFWQEPQDNVAPELGVRGLVHHTHAAMAEFLNNATVGYRLASHVAIAAERAASELRLAQAYAGRSGVSTHGR